MTNVIRAVSVSEALSKGLRLLLARGIEEPSRNGGVLVMSGPVITEYLYPERRVLFSPLRDANPFFHLMEALWMLAGRRDLAFPKQFNKRFGEYSDDGETLHAAYGHRWRYNFGVDQVEAVIVELRRDPATRRAVISMADPARDIPALQAGGKDLPCNTTIYFDARGGAINMTVCCRSNDILWGAYGANAVHFSILQEFVAACVGLPAGIYRQMSNNYHLYLNVLNQQAMRNMALEADASDAYRQSGRFFVAPLELVQGDPKEFLYELTAFLADPLSDYAYNEPFFGTVAAPMYAAWNEWKTRAPGWVERALNAAGAIAASDWNKACVEWLQRRIEKLEGSKQ